jgi:hypothetical protein
MPSAPAPLPYASPTPLARLGDLFRDGHLLLARDGATFPPRCILCGRDSAPSRPIPLTFTWDASFTVTRQSTLELRQKAAVRAFLCPHHRARWQAGRLAGIAGIALALALMAAGMTVSVFSESSDIPRYTPVGIGLTLAGFALLILALFLFTLRTRTLTCTRIDAGYVTLDGASPAFLHPLPPLPDHAKPPPAPPPPA